MLLKSKVHFNLLCIPLSLVPRAVRLDHIIKLELFDGRLGVWFVLKELSSDGLVPLMLSDDLQLILVLHER